MDTSNASGKVSQDYWATLGWAGFFSPAGIGCLRISGEDRYVFLQRQTSNNLDLLQPGKSITSILLSPTARILDVLRLIDMGEYILTLTLPAHGADTLRYLKNRIFFMDKVELTDISPEFSQTNLEGPGAGDVLRKLGVQAPQGRDEPARAIFLDKPLLVLEEPGLVGRGFRLLAAAENQAQLIQTLSELGVAPLSPESYHILRIEAGLPGAGAELSEAYTPLEVGMGYALSDNKGCYPGQEVIARQITYDKVTQQMVGLRLDGYVEPGATLFAADKPAGTVTSSVVSPRFGLIALGVVKRPYHEVGTTLNIQNNSSVNPTRAKVVSLPFTEE